MKTATVKELKTELSNYSEAELVQICLRLSKFKKENKELLTYVLFESENENYYIESIKRKIDDQFDQINAKTYYYIKKSIRKILRTAKKYIRYSGSKETEVEVLLYFCQKMKDFKPSIKRNQVLINLFNRQLDFIEKVITKLHEDLQYDYSLEIQKLQVS